MKNIALFLLGLILFTSQFSCNTEDKKTKSAVTEKIRIANNGVNIDYTETGKADTVLLFVHGWGINRSYWADQEKYFSGRFRVVAIDLPGFGQSGKNRNDWSVEAYGKDVNAVIDQLKLNNVILIGHSMAGDIVAEAAVNDSIHIIGLVGIDNFKTVGYKLTKEDKEGFAKALAEMKVNFTEVITGYFNRSLFSPSTDSSVRKRVLYDVTHSDSVIAVAAMEVDEYDEAGKLAAAKKKLYLINSDVTPTDTAGFVKNNIPYKIEYIHGTGHYPMIEKTAEFNAAMDKIIATILKKE